MKRLIGFLLALVGCSQADGRPVVTIVAAGDTAKIYVSWTATSPKATGALGTVTVGATNGVWSSLPNNSAVTASGTMLVIATSAAADSGLFSVCLRSTNGPQISAQACTAKQWKRILQPPIVTIDSLTSLLVFPKAPTVATNGTVLFCTFGQFASGAVVLGSGDTTCAALYQASIPAAARLKSSPVLVAVWDSVCVTFAASSGSFTDAPACPLSLRDGLRWQVAAR